MSGRKLILFVLVLLLAIFATFAFAKTPTYFDDGWWGNTQVSNGFVSFDFDIPSLELFGTATQPIDAPGRAAQGVDAIANALQAQKDTLCRTPVHRQPPAPDSDISVSKATLEGYLALAGTPAVEQSMVLPMIDTSEPTYARTV